MPAAHATLFRHTDLWAHCIVSTVCCVCNFPGFANFGQSCMNTIYDACSIILCVTHRIQFTASVLVNHTICILRYSRRFEGKIYNAVEWESRGPSPYSEKWGFGPHVPLKLRLYMQQRKRCNFYVTVRKKWLRSAGKAKLWLKVCINRKDITLSSCHRDSERRLDEE